MRELSRFHGGIHPAEHKLESSEAPSRRAPLPARLILPLHQHIGNGARVEVQVGARVLKGQLLASAQGTISAPIHAPTSGTVIAIEPHAVPHPSALSGLCIHLVPDGEDRWIAHSPLDYRALPKAELLDRLRDAGIVGLGGAAFPTHVKYRLTPGQRIQTLVINGAECEPWITTDDRLMRERAAEIVGGIEVLRHLVEPAEVLVGIEDNKPQAIAAMRAACAGSDIEVVVVPTLYPSGGEKQLIKILTGKEVPSGGRPTYNLLVEALYPWFSPERGRSPQGHPEGGRRRTPDRAVWCRSGNEVRHRTVVLDTAPTRSGGQQWQRL